MKQLGHAMSVSFTTLFPSLFRHLTFNNNDETGNRFFAHHPYYFCHKNQMNSSKRYFKLLNSVVFNPFHKRHPTTLFIFVVHIRV